ncbi:MAG: hypothetical protein WAO20_21980 [Acidobacteriota bacterium]
MTKIRCRARLGLLAALVCILFQGTSCHQSVRLPEVASPLPDRARKSAAVAERILADPDLPYVLEKARAVLGSGLNAGSGYGEVWIRDFNTFIELSLQVRDSRSIRQALLVFFHFQPEDGNIIDGYIPAAKASAGYDYTESETMPQFKGHKNTVETDQESSLVQAVYKYVQVTGDRSILQETVNEKSVLSRLQLALDYVLSRRFDTDYGLVWGATTVDWGDVQPEHEWGVAFDQSSHRAIDVYDNAMFVIAADNLVELLRDSGADSSRWSAARDRVRSNARRYLWDARRHKFRPHIYLDGSPFPADFEEDRIYYHGGTAIAIEAGFLNRDEIGLVLKDLRNNVRFAGAASIGLTVFPAYPSGYFKNPAMKPYSYQNGGDWSWFGGRMIQQLIEHGFVEDAYTELIPMLQRVRRNNGFFEWYTVDDQPRGSGTFRGSAGVLGKAVLMLQSWAEESRRPAPNPSPSVTSEMESASSSEQFEGDPQLLRSKFAFR